MLGPGRELKITVRSAVTRELLVLPESARAGLKKERTS
jgi:hypothetical protein